MMVLVVLVVVMVNIHDDGMVVRVIYCDAYHDGCGDDDCTDEGSHDDDINDNTHYSDEGLQSETSVRKFFSLRCTTYRGVKQVLVLLVCDQCFYVFFFLQVPHVAAGGMIVFIYIKPVAAFAKCQ